MKSKTKAYATLIVFFAFSFALVTTATGAGSIALPSTPQAPGASVSVAGTGFGATKNVVLVFGSEINVLSEPLTPVDTGPTTRAYNWTNGPIKPGSMHIHLNSITFPGAQYDYFDDGAGKLLRDYDGALLGIVDYALGGFSRNATGAATENEWTASYTCYQHNVTSFGRVTTTGSGTFSVNFTVPNVANGNYNVTAIDSGGTFATATLSVGVAIPEVLPFGVMMLLSSFTAIVSLRHFRKSPKILN